MKTKIVFKSPREIASEWHGGQASPLYAYSCTGHIDPYLQREIRWCWNSAATTSKDKIELAHLWCAVADNLTVDDMKNGEYWHRTLKNADGSPLRARITGVMITWKTRPGKFRIPVKHGLRDSGYITHENIHEWCLPI